MCYSDVMGSRAVTCVWLVAGGAAGRPAGGQCGAAAAHDGADSQQPAAEADAPGHHEGTVRLHPV